ncbi:obscurin-like [Mugil cephalus]|uniref:obscurin-like n=1 Tax=Mugil cephalus TaxID=48193 RepID=UPI001FB7C0DA|nr:obscurin-like [Mugil cephalus]
MHTSRYMCYAGRGEPEYYTGKSNPVFVWSRDVNSAVSLKVSPIREQYFLHESVTLSCEGNAAESRVMVIRLTGRGYRSSCYTWGNMTGSTCTIKRLQYRDAVYWCVTESGKLSNGVNITILVKPKPFLSVFPPWLSPGASVTLSCEVEHPSAGWRFYWYKAVPDLSDNYSTYRYELLPGSTNGTAEDFYIIHGETQTSQYRCRAGRGEPVYHTHYSEPKFVWSGALDDSLIIPLFTGVFTGILLVVLLLPLLYFIKSKDLCGNRRTRSQDTNQDQQLNKEDTQEGVYCSLGEGDDCLYESACGAEDRRNAYDPESSCNYDDVVDPLSITDP